jgi:hypothetical protein
MEASEGGNTQEEVDDLMHRLFGERESSTKSEKEAYTRDRTYSVARETWRHMLDCSDLVSDSDQGF